jgi:hypothetical protein
LNESAATAIVNAGLPKRRMRVWKVSDTFTSGIPDVYYGGNYGRSLWAEYKIVKLKNDLKTLDVSAGTKGNGRLSAKQQEWLNDEYARGHNVAVILIHYRPRNSHYYVLRDGQWNERQDANRITRFDKPSLIAWILDEVDVLGRDEYEQAATQ